MSTISRSLPRTILARQAALVNALNKLNNTPPGVQVLNPATSTRLVAAVPVTNAVIQAVGTAQANLSFNTPLKNAAVDNTRTFVNHFIQVFNLGVRRGKYPAGHRAFYLLDITSDAVPDLESETEVGLWAQRLISGDADRLLAGGLPMDNPAIPEVAGMKTLSDAGLNTQSILSSLLDEKQEYIEGQLANSDNLIKRIWDEVEAFYGEESPESKRHNARQWGVVYISKGPAAQLTGIIKDAAGNPLEEAEIELIQTGSKAVTNHEGRYILTTTVVGPVTLRATYPGKPDVELEVNIPEHDDELEININEIIMA